ncbi:hypothetical protein AAFF_G00184170 [Aldrovandia affinis]|uniref:Uncharacterized protein n=1 Tax=Aldrovandia affinis TaxID=143900 RepID=A0AAD7W6W7_9TELE|nr:hypothetical protein AAFF_G00184170 [Aldrovandia affinis]
MQQSVRGRAQRAPSPRGPRRGHTAILSPSTPPDPRGEHPLNVGPCCARRPSAFTPPSLTPMPVAPRVAPTMQQSVRGRAQRAPSPRGPRRGHTAILSPSTPPDPRGEHPLNVGPCCARRPSAFTPPSLTPNTRGGGAQSTAAQSTATQRQEPTTYSPQKTTRPLVPDPFCVRKSTTASRNSAPK